MISPFTSSKEFLEAKGPIYTFANSPAIISFLLILTLLIVVYFIYSSYAMQKEGGSKASNPAVMGMLLVAGLATSLADPLMGTQKKQPTTAHRQDTYHQQRVGKADSSLGMLLGAIGGASSLLGRQFQAQRRSTSRRRRQQRF
jgi:hypothetical protein